MPPLLSETRGILETAMEAEQKQHKQRQSLVQEALSSDRAGRLLRAAVDMCHASEKKMAEIEEAEEAAELELSAHQELMEAFRESDEREGTEESGLRVLELDEVRAFSKQLSEVRKAQRVLLETRTKHVRITDDLHEEEDEEEEARLREEEAAVQAEMSEQRHRLAVMQQQLAETQRRVARLAQGVFPELQVLFREADLLEMAAAGPVYVGQRSLAAYEEERRLTGGRGAAVGGGGGGVVRLMRYAGKRCVVKTFPHVGAASLRSFRREMSSLAKLVSFFSFFFFSFSLTFSSCFR